MLDENESILANIQKQYQLLVQDKKEAQVKIRKLEIEIKELMKAINDLRRKHSLKERELKIEIKAIEKQFNKLEQENNQLKEQLSDNSVSYSSKHREIEEVEEIDEALEVLQNFDPTYWPPIQQLITDKPLTLDILRKLIEKRDINLVILAMMLMTDHVVCLEILEELQAFDVVEIINKKEGDLNPQIILQNYLS